MKHNTKSKGKLLNTLEKAHKNHKPNICWFKKPPLKQDWEESIKMIFKVNFIGGKYHIDEIIKDIDDLFTEQIAKERERSFNNGKLTGKWLWVKAGREEYQKQLERKLAKERKRLISLTLEGSVERARALNIIDDVLAILEKTDGEMRKI